MGDEICSTILNLFEWYRAKFSLECIGYVLMPDHLHALLHQREAGAQVSEMMAGFKRESSKQIPLKGYPGTTLWGDRYDDVPVPGLDAVKQSWNTCTIIRFDAVWRKDPNSISGRVHETILICVRAESKSQSLSSGQVKNLARRGTSEH